MAAYRTAPASTETLDIGNRRDFRLRLAGAAVSVCAALGAIVLAVVTKQPGGTAWVVTMAVLAAIALARTRHCRIEVSRSEREVRVTVERLGSTIHERVGFDLVESVQIAPSSFTTDKPEYLLQIVRSKGAAITLLRAPHEAELRAERERLGRFLLDTGAMAGPRPRVAEPLPADTGPRARVADATPEDATHAPGEQAEPRAHRRT